MTELAAAADQAWPAFVLVAGLLLVGAVAASEGLFSVLGARVALLPGGDLVLFLSLMGLVAAVTVVLNLDTSVVFLTPIVLEASRRRGAAEGAFLYGVVFMSNSASLLLGGSNLTNLMVFGPLGLGGTAVAGRMVAAWAVAIACTALVVAVWRRHDWRRGADQEAEVPAFCVSIGLVAVLAAGIAVVVLRHPALPVLGLGLAAGAAELATRRTTFAALRETLGVLTLTALFLLAVALGAAARASGAPARLMASASSVTTAVVAGASSVAVNNLPAAVVWASGRPRHPAALLVGLDLAPNLAVTGALSAILWLRVARRSGASPSARTYSAVGLVLVPVSMAGALLALWLTGGS